MKTIALADCPYDWVAIDNGWEILLKIGAWHEHLSREEYLKYESLLNDGVLELQEKHRGKTIVTTRMVRFIDGKEHLLSETGLLFSPFWKPLSYKHYKIKIAS
jgi:hypothetical protein